MKMYEVEVEVQDGEICISQMQYDDIRQAVAITPDQAELVCEWIMNAAKALRAEG